MAGFSKKKKEKPNNKPEKKFKIENKEIQETEVDLGSIHKIKSKDRESSIIIDKFFKSDFEVPEEVDEFIVLSVDYVDKKLTDSLFKPYFIGNFHKDTYIDEAIKNSSRKIDFSDSIEDSGVIEIEEMEEVEVV